MYSDEGMGKYEVVQRKNIEGLKKFEGWET